MKKISSAMAVAMLCLFTACNRSGTTTSSNTDSSGNAANDNLAKNRSIYKAIETGDSATINSLIADDAVDHQGPNGKDIKGGNNIKHWLTDMHNHVKDLKFDVLSDATKGDYIFAMVDMRGTASDSALGAPAGTKLDGKSVDVVKISNGKMVEHWGFVDPNMMMQMSPPKGNIGATQSK
jgi:ketosteroid isomerase-like protein